MTTTLQGPRPQPLGVLPWPAGMMVLPDGPECDRVAADLIQGKLPDVWPQSLAFVAAALDDAPEAAAARITGDSMIDRYNRAVLLGGDEAWQALAADCEGELLALVDTARYSVGACDLPPSADGLGGEVAALVHSARASAAMERADRGATIDELSAGITAATTAGSPILASSLRLSLAEFLRDTGDAPGAARQADLALQTLPTTADRELRAQLQVTRALARQELAGTDRGALLAVVADLTEATKIFREDTHPELFAVCNQHLAIAYLVMPMSDQGDRIRQGVAVNALRAALRVFTPQNHPVAWASTQVNLANALQYLDSVHREQNLDEAVQLYEEVLQSRDPAADPLGYARILSNQGNALGHLGVFADARERLTRAQELFAQYGDTDSVATVDGIIASLADAEAAARREGNS